MNTDIPDAEKVYDAEETKAETAKRLLGRDLMNRQEAGRKLRDRLRIHARHLARADRMAAIERLRRDADLTIGLLEDTGDELPEFIWPSDSVDQEWSL